MGGTRYDPGTYRSYARATAAKSHVDYHARALPKDFDPKQIKVRESRRHDLNPNPTPIIVGLDVSGSMGRVVEAMRKGLGTLFEQIIASLDASLIRPDRKGEPPRFGKLGKIRQWIESIYQTAKSQLSLEDHGGHIPEGVWTRVCQRVLALAAGVWHSWALWEAGLIDAPGRHFINYDH